ncbi:hypothetical protein Tco_1260857 [Tanacetum coccineum]
MTSYTGHWMQSTLWLTIHINGTTGLLGYYTCVDNRLPFGEKKPSLEELMNHHYEKSMQRRAEMVNLMKKLQESTNLNTRNQNASLKNLETQIEKLAKDYQAKAANEVHDSSIGHCKEIFGNGEAQRDGTSSDGTNKLHGVSFISNDNEQEWLKLKIGHTNINKSVKSVVLKEWILDSFDVESYSAGIRNDPYSRRLDEYKAMFDNEIEQLANEYELRIGKKGYILDDIWENVNMSMGEQCTHGTRKDLKKKSDGKVV